MERLTSRPRLTDELAWKKPMIGAEKGSEHPKTASVQKRLVIQCALATESEFLLRAKAAVTLQCKARVTATRLHLTQVSTSLHALALFWCIIDSVLPIQSVQPDINLLGCFWFFPHPKCLRRA